MFFGGPGSTSCYIVLQAPYHKSSAGPGAIGSAIWPVWLLLSADAD